MNKKLKLIKELEEFILYSENNLENFTNSFNSYLDYQGANLDSLKKLLLKLKENNNEIRC